MIVEARIAVAASRAALWATITDIEHAATSVKGIEQIEIVARPAQGLVGLRWRETRILFGDPATVEKWITEAVDQESYRTRAESDGFVFLTTRRIVQGEGGLVLVDAHESRPQTLLAWLKMIPMALLFRGVIRKALLQDLADIKAAAERP